MLWPYKVWNAGVRKEKPILLRDILTTQGRPSKQSVRLGATLVLHGLPLKLEQWSPRLKAKKQSYPVGLFGSWNSLLETTIHTEYIRVFNWTGSRPSSTRVPHSKDSWQLSIECRTHWVEGNTGFQWSPWWSDRTELVTELLPLGPRFYPCSYFCSWAWERFARCAPKTKDLSQLLLCLLLSAFFYRRWAVLRNKGC